MFPNPEFFLIGFVPFPQILVLWANIFVLWYSDALFPVMDNYVLFFRKLKAFCICALLFAPLSCLDWIGFLPVCDDWDLDGWEWLTLYFCFSIKIHDLTDMREMYAIINLDDENKGMLTFSMGIEIFTN